MIIGRRTPLFLPVLVDNVFEMINSEILVLYFGVERNLKFISARMLINDTGMAQRPIQNDQKFWKYKILSLEKQKWSFILLKLYISRYI